MKTTILLDDLSVSEIRPDLHSSEYAELRRAEATGLVSNPNTQWTGRQLPTPNCVPESAFTSDSMQFHHCSHCGSIFAAPVPCQIDLDGLNANGEASRFRTQHFDQQFSARQRIKINAPIVRWIAQVCEELNIRHPDFAYVGNDDTGAMDSILDVLSPSAITVIEQTNQMLPPLSHPQLSFNEAPDNQYDIIVDLGSLEKVSAPNKRMKLWNRILNTGGVLMLTTNSASSIEYRLLGANAPSFIALDRLTLFSVSALQEALDLAGFDLLELSTPGRVDVELLKYGLEKQDARGIEFWHHTLKHGTDFMIKDLQNFLQQHLLSSYMRVLARKR
jgi:SAM-dependent methyltransferase